MVRSCRADIPPFGMVLLPARLPRGRFTSGGFPCTFISSLQRSLLRSGRSLGHSIASNIPTNGQKWLRINCRPSKGVFCSQTGVNGEREREGGSFERLLHCCAARDLSPPSLSRIHFCSDSSLSRDNSRAENTNSASYAEDVVFEFDGRFQFQTEEL